MDTALNVKILDEAVYISRDANTHGKGINPTSLILLTNR